MLNKNSFGNYQIIIVIAAADATGSSNKQDLRQLLPFEESLGIFIFITDI